MRIHKYRAWISGWSDGTSKMIYSDSIKDRNNSLNFFPINKDDVLMEWTGLQDKHGKDVYEGDIVYCADKSRHFVHFINKRQVYFKAKVIFRNGCFTFERLEYPDDGLGIGQFGIDPLNLFGEESLSKYDLEVLGNEFENPELLEVK